MSDRLHARASGGTPLPARPAPRRLFRFAAAGLLAGAPLVCAQELIDPHRPGARRLLDRIEQDLAPSNGDRLACKVDPIAPWLNFAFRWQAGYRVRLPLRQFPEESFAVRIAFRVTPEGGTPVVFRDRFEIPPGRRTGGQSGRFGGGFFVGEGRYRVEWVLVGPGGRKCRKEWTFSLELNARQRRTAGLLEPGSVAPIVLEWDEPIRRSRRPYRLAVVLHVAPLFPRAIRLSRFDRAFLTTLLLSLFENTGFRETAIHAVSLEKQQTIFETSELDGDAFRRLLEAMEKFELGTIGIDQYANPRGRIDFLAELVNRFTVTPDPPDAVVFLGPNTRHTDKFPGRRIERADHHKPLFFYLHFDYFSWRFPWPDTIERLTKSQRGRVFDIRKPAQLARALEQMERMIEANRRRAAVPVRAPRTSLPAVAKAGEPVLFRAPLFRDPEQVRWLENPRDVTLRGRRRPWGASPKRRNDGLPPMRPFPSGP